MPDVGSGTGNDRGFAVHLAEVRRYLILLVVALRKKELFASSDDRVTPEATEVGIVRATSERLREYGRRWCHAKTNA